MSRTRTHAVNAEARHRALLKVDDLSSEDPLAPPVQTVAHVLVQGALENA